MANLISDKVSHSEARKALEENLNLLDPEKHKAARNLTIALAYLFQSQNKLLEEVDLLHRKLQPILKHLEEDNSDWRSRTIRGEEH